MAYQMCYGKYVQNDPCSPFCSKPDGSGCDYSPMSNPYGSNPYGKTGDPYSVTAESITQDGTTTTLTAVPRFSTQNFFQRGQMDGLSPSTPANGGGGTRALPHCSCGDGTTCRGELGGSSSTKCCCCGENSGSAACKELSPREL